LSLRSSFDPGIILLDIDLRDMSGYDAARLLHHHPRLQKMRLIAAQSSWIRARVHP
jgi:CheY-like chemotaxis protein